MSNLVRSSLRAGGIRTLSEGLAGGVLREGADTVDGAGRQGCRAFLRLGLTVDGFARFASIGCLGCDRKRTGAIS